MQEGDFLSGPAVKTSPSNAGGVGSIPGRELRSHIPPPCPKKGVNLFKEKNKIKHSGKGLGSLSQSAKGKGGKNLIPLCCW